MNAFSPLTSADGSVTLIDPETGEAFKSRHGSETETYAVFLQPGVLENPRLGESEPFQVLECGFGLGMNYFTLASWRRNATWAPKIRYIGIDRSFAAAAAALEHIPRERAYRLEKLLSTREAEEPGLHTLLLEGDFFSTIAQLPSELTFDAIFFDPFSPKTQGSSWDTASARELGRRLRPGGRMVTYSVARAARDFFLAAGLQLERKRLPEILHKRESLIGTQVERDLGLNAI